MPELALLYVLGAHAPSFTIPSRWDFPDSYPGVLARERQGSFSRGPDGREFGGDTRLRRGKAFVIARAMISEKNSGKLFMSMRDKAFRSKSGHQMA